VYAVRFRLYTGWHAFAFGSKNELDREAERLDGVLHRKWFATLEGRRQFRCRHPECAGFNWGTVRLRDSQGHD